MLSKEEPSVPENWDASLEDLLDLQDIFELRRQVLQITDELQEEVETAKERAKTRIAQLLANIAMPKPIAEDSTMPRPDEQLPAVIEKTPEKTTHQPMRIEKKLRGKLQNRILAIVEANDKPLPNGAVVETYNQLYEKEPATYASISNTLNILTKKKLIRRPKRGLYERKEPRSSRQEQSSKAEVEKRISDAHASLEENTRKEKIYDMGALLLLNIRQADIQRLLDDRTLFSGMESEIIEHYPERDSANSQNLDIEQISHMLDLSIQEAQEIEHEVLYRLHRLFEEDHGQTVKSILHSEETTECIKNLDPENLEELILHRNQSKTLLAEKLLTVKDCCEDWCNLINDAAQAYCSEEQYETLDLLYELSSFRKPDGVTKALTMLPEELEGAHKRAALLAVCEGAGLEDPNGPFSKILAAVDTHLAAHSTEKNQ